MDPQVQPRLASGDLRPPPLVSDLFGVEHALNSEGDYLAVGVGEVDVGVDPAPDCSR